MNLVEFRLVSNQVFVHFYLVRSWRTLAYQEVRLRIGPLAKLGRFKSTANNFLVYIVTISLVSGPIRSLTSWYAKVLHGSIFNQILIMTEHKSKTLHFKISSCYFTNVLSKSETHWEDVKM